MVDRIAYRRGHTGPAVAEIRARLARVGLLPPYRHGSDPVHAVFDDDVDTAVRTFQQQREITVDGIVGPETFRRLEEARWSLGDRTLMYTPGHMTSGDDVAQLQRRLTGMGFDCGRVDGIFGPLTDRALREFQRGVGLEADGTAGPSAFRALDRLVRTVGGGAPEQLREALELDAVRTGVADKVVVLDPGHGGPDPGHVDGHLVEAEVVDAVIGRVEGRLAALGTTVLLTRGVHHEVDDRLDEDARASFCNDIGADLVVSLHTDASRSAAATGLATFYYGGDRYGASSVLGERAARLLHDEVLARTDLQDCRCHGKTWQLLRLTRMPAVRMELGYLSNDRDASLLSDDGFVDVVAEGIAAGVVHYFTPGSPD